MTGILNTVYQGTKAADWSFEGTDINVTFTNDALKAKEPVFLQIRHGYGPEHNIGIINPVHLRGNDWDTKPYKELYRTILEIKEAVVKRVNLFLDAKKNRALHIDTESGVIFNFKDVDVNVQEDNTFSVNGKVVTLFNRHFHLSEFQNEPFSEDVIEFRKQEDGSIQLFSAIDQREGKKMFIDSNGGLLINQK